MQTAPKMIVGLAFFVSFVQSSTAYASFNYSLDPAFFNEMINRIIGFFVRHLVMDVCLYGAVFLAASFYFQALRERKSLSADTNSRPLTEKTKQSIDLRPPLVKHLELIMKGFTLLRNLITPLFHKESKLSGQTLVIACLIGPVTTGLCFWLVMHTHLFLQEPVMRTLVRIFYEPYYLLLLGLIPKIPLVVLAAFFWVKFGKFSKHQDKEIPITGVEPLKEKQPKESSIISVEQLKAAIAAEADDES